MTRNFRMVLIGAMLAGLLVVPTGFAQADTVSGGGNGTGFEWTVPTVTIPGVNAPKLEIELNGEKKTIGGDNAVPGTSIGGVLKVGFRASDWLVSYTSPDCLPGQIGKGVALTGKTPSATLQASYTPISGTAQNLAPSPVDNRYPTANFTLCV